MFWNLSRYLECFLARLTSRRNLFRTVRQLVNTPLRMEHRTTPTSGRGNVRSASIRGTIDSVGFPRIVISAQPEESREPLRARKEYNRSERLTWALTRLGSRVAGGSSRGILAQVRRSQVRSAWRAGLAWHRIYPASTPRTMMVFHRTTTLAAYYPHSRTSVSLGSHYVEAECPVHCLKQCAHRDSH